MLVFYSQIPQDANSADPSKAETQIIRSLAVSPSEETLVASTEMNQLFNITLSTADLGKVYIRYFTLANNTVFCPRAVLFKNLLFIN